MQERKICSKTLSEGTYLHTLFDKEYKTEYLTLFISMPLTLENATKTSLLARVLQRGSEHFPTMTDISRALDTNFASSVGVSAFKCGEREVFCANLSCLKDRFAPNGEKIFEKGVEILKDIVFSPLVKDGKFCDEYFVSEKQNLKDSINAQKNNKASWSRRRFISHMCENEAFSINGEGDEKTADKITNEELYLFWRDVVLNSPADIYYVGEQNDAQVEKSVLGFFTRREVLPLPKTLIVSKAKEVKNVCENTDIFQGHMWIGYRTGITYSSPNYLEAVLFNMLLGGDVTGKMFMNLREKMSLCYSCHSTLDATKGILTAYAGIDSANFEKAKGAFFEQLEKIKNGEITEDEVLDAKKSFANRMREISDNPSMLPMWYFMRREAGDLRDPERDARDIMKTDVKSAVEFAKSISLDTVYILAGGEKE